MSKERVKDISLRVSAMVIIISALLHQYRPVIASWLMAIAVVVYSIVTVLTPYPGKTIRGRRLHRFQLIACALMVVSAYLMFKQRNEWALTLLLGASFLTYVSFIMPKVVEREKRDNEQKHSDNR